MQQREYEPDNDKSGTQNPQFQRLHCPETIQSHGELQYGTETFTITIRLPHK